MSELSPAHVGSGQVMTVVGPIPATALGITAAHNGLALDAPPFELLARRDAVELVAGPRIGITKAAHVPWRYGLSGSRYLSKPFK